MTQPPDARDLPGGWPVYEVRPGIEARVTAPMPDLPPKLEQEVERLWQAAQRRTGGKLFNGQVFSADTLTPSLLTGHMTEFRRIVAQMDRPGLFEALKVRPLAVCGAVLSRPAGARDAQEEPDGQDGDGQDEGGVVLGRRAGHSVYQAGYWQTPPAGSVDAGALRDDGSLDLPGQLMKELLEELGIGAAAVTECTPLLMIEHPDSHVLDIGYRMTVDLSAAAVLAAHRERANDEYDPIRVLPLAGLPASLRGLGGTLSPPSHAIMRASGWLDEKI